MSEEPLSGVAARALEHVPAGGVIGLGTGRAASAFVRALGSRVRAGLRLRGVPTSEATARLARDQGIPLASLDEVDEIDVTFDGADEVDRRLDMIKGYGGALVREKVVAESSRRRVMLIGAEKVVGRVGERRRLPVEVIPFARRLCERRLAALGCPAELRRGEAGAYRTDNGNLILDCAIEPLEDPAGLERAILAIPGVVGTGLFLGLADIVLVQDGDEVRVLERERTG